jgi:hypothetical protein
VRYTAGESCEFGAPPEPPPPPSGDAGTIHVMDISMTLDARATQAIARVTVANGLGQPVVGAMVTGAWSGVITSGDTTRTTDDAGVATFYSSRTRTLGDVSYCVSGVAGQGLAYDAAQNVDTCGSITK